MLYKVRKVKDKSSLSKFDQTLVNVYYYYNYGRVCYNSTEFYEILLK